MAPVKLKRFDLSFRTAYAQAKEGALAQREVPLLTPGTLQTEKRGNSRFVYRYRYDCRGARARLADRAGAVQCDCGGLETLTGQISRTGGFRRPSYLAWPLVT
jgi:hypothetical protein